MIFEILYPDRTFLDLLAKTEDTNDFSQLKSSMSMLKCFESMRNNSQEITPFTILLNSRYSFRKGNESKVRNFEKLIKINSFTDFLNDFVSKAEKEKC